MNSEHKPVLRLDGEGADAVRTVLLSKLVHPVAIICPFEVEIGAASGDFSFTVAPQDKPEFAADKILDAIEERGWISLPGERLTAAEEGVLRGRLTDLGYIE